MNSDVTFSFFVTLWNRITGNTTPDVHFDITEWMDSRVGAGDLRLLLMAFRGCGKSTLVGLFIAWSLYRNPDLRVLVLSANEDMAERMVRHVRRIIETHPLTARLIPDAPDQWTRTRLTVKRDSVLRDPSVVACGLQGNMTGMRADLIVCDDVEVPDTSETAGKRADLRERLGQLNYICTPEGRILYVGTPHTFDTIYAISESDRVDVGAPFLAGYECLKIPVVDSDGHSRWPERFSDETLERLRRATARASFNSQMLLIPSAPEETYFDSSQINIYREHPVYVPELGAFYLGSRRLFGCSAYWDPALARGSGDSSVLAVVFTDDEGALFVHKTAYLEVDAQSKQPDAIQQTEQVSKILQDLRVPVVGVEINGLGRMLTPLLRRELTRNRVGTAVVDVNNVVPKNTRIQQALETPLAARMIWVHDSVVQTPFIQELRDFRPNRDNGRDDGLDAVAGAMAMQPLRLDIPRGMPVLSRPCWRSARVHFARTT